MNLATNYLGLELAHPIIATAGPLTQSVGDVCALAEAGASAIVLHSLFEEQVRHEELRDVMVTEVHEESFAESLSYFPTVPARSSGPTTSYLHLLEQALNNVTVPVIASINGTSRGGWTDVARRIQDSGTQALELNIYLVPDDLSTTGREVEDNHVRIVESVCQSVTIPVAVKVSPYFSAFGNMARRLTDAGARGLVLFNRFLQPDIDVETMTSKAGVQLSGPADGRIARSWIATLRGHLDTSLCGSSGVETPDDVVRYLLAGADVVGTTSALVRHGVDYLSELKGGLVDWLRRKEFTSVAQARGILANPDDSGTFGRQGYVSGLEQAKETFGAFAPPVATP